MRSGDKIDRHNELGKFTIMLNSVISNHSIRTLVMGVICACCLLNCATYQEHSHQNDAVRELIRTTESNVANARYVEPSKLEGTEIYGHYTLGSGLAGEELILFPDNTYTLLEWADIMWTQIIDDGKWSVQGPYIHLRSSKQIDNQTHTSGTEEQEMFPFQYQDSEGNLRLRLLSDTRYSDFKEYIKQEDEAGKESWFHICSIEKSGAQVDWNQIARDLLYWNDDYSPIMAGESDESISQEHLRDEIPPDIEWQEFKKLLYYQYRDHINQYSDWLSEQPPCTPSPN